MSQRKIIHIDMDAFYASVEQRDRPEYRGRPIAVGYDGPRGVVATASYEARPYGVHSALSSVLAKRLCPELIFVPARFDVYKAVSRQIRAIFGEYTELVEPLSLDEAFLDVSHVRSATLVAREIKARILAETGLTASAGISVNKMLAKIASDYRKPDGLFTIPPERIEEFVAGLPVERFFGIGEVTAEKMHRLGIRTGADLRLWNEAALVQQFGKAGHSYYGYARGIDEREGTPNRVRKSLGAETTFAEDTDDRERLRLELSAVREEVWNRVMRHEFRGKTVVLKLKFDNFRQITRSKTLFTPVDSAETLRRVSEELLAAADFHGRKNPADRTYGRQLAGGLPGVRAAAVRLREPGNVKAPAITGNGMAFARLPSKKGAMKHTDRTGAEQTAARQPEPTQEITVTQVTPDDILNDGGPITPATGDGTPTERQLEQGVVMVNPSVDSMESRG